MKELPPLSSEASRKSPEPQVCKNKAGTPLISLRNSDPADSNYNFRRRKFQGRERGSYPPASTIKTTKPSSHKSRSSNGGNYSINVNRRVQTSPLSTKQTVATDPEEDLSEDEEMNISLAHLVSGKRTSQEGDPYHNSIDAALKDSLGNGLRETDSEMTAGPSKDLVESKHQVIKRKKGPKGKRGRKPGFVWKYFYKYPDKSVCKECGKTYKGSRPHTISAKHLRRKHLNLYKLLWMEKRNAMYENLFGKSSKHDDIQH